MEFELLSKWGGLLGLIISVITGVWTLISKSTKPFDDRLDAQDTKLDKIEEAAAAHDRRIQSTEERLTHLPNKDEFHKMQLGMVEMQGGMKLLTKSGEATERTVRRIDEYLRENGK